MPTYRVKTDRGEFEVELDRPPTSDEELRRTVEAGLSKGLMEREPEGPGLQLKSEEVRSPRQAMQEAIEFGAPAALATAGGIVGEKFGGPLGAFGGSVIGGGTGQAIAELTRPGLTGQRSSLPDVGARIASEAAMAGAGELAGQGLFRMAGKSVAPFAKSVTPEARAAQEALTRVGGGRLSPAQMTENRFLDIIEGLTESSFGGGRLLKLHERTATKGVERLTDEFLDQVGTELGPTAVAQALVDTRKLASRLFQISQRSVWQNLDEAAQGTLINTEAFVTFVHSAAKGNRRHVEEALRLADVDIGTLLQTTVPRKIGDPLQPGSPARILNETSFRDAHEAVSRLKEIARRKPASLEDQAVVNTAGKLAGMLDTAIESAAQRLNPAALADYQAAKAVTAEGYARLENALIRKAFKRLEAEPGALEAVYFRAKRPDLLVKTRAAVGDDTFQALSARLATTLVESSKDAATGIVSGKALLNRLKGLGQETVEAMFPKTAKDIETFGKVIEFIERKSPEKTGQVFMRLAQAGSAFQVITEPLASFTKKTGQLAYSVVLGPVLMGRLLSSERGIQWLTTGFRAGPGTQTFFRALAQAAQSAARPEASKRPLTIDEARAQGVRVRTDMTRTTISPLAVGQGQQ